MRIAAAELGGSVIDSAHASSPPSSSESLSSSSGRPYPDRAPAQTVDPSWTMQRTLGCGVVFESVPSPQAQLEPAMRPAAAAVALPASPAGCTVVCHPCVCLAASGACVGSCSGFGARRRWWTRRWFVPGPALMFLCGLFGITVQIPLARSAAGLRTEAENAGAGSDRALQAYHANPDSTGYQIMQDAMLRTGY